MIFKFAIDIIYYTGRMSTQRVQELLSQVPVTLGAFKDATEPAEKESKLADVVKQVEELIQEVRVSCPAPAPAVAAPVAPAAPAEPKAGWFGNLFGKKPQTGGKKKRSQKGGQPMEINAIYNVSGLITDTNNPLAVDMQAYNNLANVPPPMSTGFDKSIFASTNGINDTIMNKITPPISQTGGKRAKPKSKSKSKY